MYIKTRHKRAHPNILTPVARNYPWEEGELKNVHREYSQVAMLVAEELDAKLIDLNQRSIDHFSKKGKEYMRKNKFMHLTEGKYEAYPEAPEDNTHFQSAGAEAFATK